MCTVTHFYLSQLYINALCNALLHFVAGYIFRFTHFTAHTRLSNYIELYQSLSTVDITPGELLIGYRFTGFEVGKKIAFTGLPMGWYFSPVFFIQGVIN